METEEVEENIEHRTIGSIVHKVLEELYLPFKNLNITSQDIAAMPAKVEPLMEAAFVELYSKGQVKFGRNRLIFEVIKNFIYAFLAFEKGVIEKLEHNNGKLRIVDLEQKLWGDEYSCTLPARNNIEIKFRGTIDRVDELNGTTRIIDYKTGQVKSAADLQIKSWEDFNEGDKKDKAFQVMIYSWLYSKNENNKYNALESGIIGLRNLSNGLMSFGIKPERNSIPDRLIDEEKLEMFEQYLVTLLNDMFDESTPFSQTDKPETCRICDYKDVCNR